MENYGDDAIYDIVWTLFEVIERGYEWHIRKDDGGMFVVKVSDEAGVISREGECLWKLMTDMMSERLKENEDKLYKPSDPMEVFGLWAEKNGYDLDDATDRERAIAAYGKLDEQKQ